jgi:putative membrane protein insertion efficiency factor
MKTFTLYLIRLYQKFPTNLHFSCRFEPRCSEYTYQAVEKYGILGGIIKGMIRILKCHPLVRGGYDPLK